MPSVRMQAQLDTHAPDIQGAVGQRYEAQVKLGHIEPHPAQRHLATLLDGLSRRLISDRAERRHGTDAARRAGEVRDGGIYIHGPVGGGKTMLLDMFFDSVEVTAKRRMHIHEFMAEFHERLGASGDRGIEQGSGNAAKTMYEGVDLFCIDEVAVSDIGDAAILSRVFADLLAQGTVLVLTANVAPGGLYEGGLNRVLFTPLIRLLTDTLEVVRLDPGTDFRLLKGDTQSVWFVSADAVAALDEAFARLTGGAAPESLAIAVRGHLLRIPKHARGVARFTFKELCLAPLWTTDYRVIARTFHTVMIEGIPARFSHRNHARRFCALIDTLHEFKVKLIASADCQPDELYAGMAAAFQPAIGPPSPTSETSPEMLEFRRTVSRLHEMRSISYAARETSSSVQP